jgi:hypothetical protein
MAEADAVHADQHRAGEGGRDEVQRRRVGLADEFIVPRRITQDYTELGGKFFAKETNGLVFHDQGDKLTTSTVDKTGIADMVLYSKAKQWDSLKLTGSQEFRREAWLQAESQGIKTQGFTPRAQDLAALKALSVERPVERTPPAQRNAQEQPEQPEQVRRYDLNKNQATSAAAAAQNSTTNLRQLQSNPGFERHSVGELSKIVFYRALIVERDKNAPLDVREAAIAKFDKAMQAPAMVKALPEPALKAEPQQEAALSEKSPQRDSSANSL